MRKTAARAGNPSDRLTEIAEREVEALSLGCALYGGGGGDPYLGSLIAREAIRDRGPVKLLDLVEFADDQILLPVGDRRCAHDLG